jgi:hypothetical protein
MLERRRLVRDGRAREEELVARRRRAPRSAAARRDRRRRRGRRRGARATAAARSREPVAQGGAPAARGGEGRSREEDEKGGSEAKHREKPYHVQSAPYPGECEEPARTFPRALFVGIALTGVIYLVVSFVAVALVDPKVFASSSGPLLEVVKAAGVSFPPWLFAGIALLAIGNTALLDMMMASRLMYGMADENIVPNRDRSREAREVTSVQAVCALHDRTLSPPTPSSLEPTSRDPGEPPGRGEPLNEVDRRKPASYALRPTARSPRALNRTRKDNHGFETNRKRYRAQ